MSTQNRNSGGGGRNQKKSNSNSGGGGDSTSQAPIKKTDASKTEKEKIHPKPTAEQLRIAQITNSNASEDPQMREKVATLIETTQRSEEEVCCALYECDNNLDRAVVFLLETLPVGAFETSSKKKKNKAANAGQENAGGDGEWTDSNANTDKREKSRNRSSNRGGRGGTDSRGWRGREARENERNLRESRGEDRSNDNYRGGPRSGGRSGGGRGGGRGGRGGGRMGGRGGGGRGDRGGSGYNSRHNANEDHQEVELWDNTIAQNAEKQMQQQDDSWGDWDNEEYVGSLKDSKVFTTSNLPNQTAASVVSGGIGGGGGTELSAPPGLEHHLGTSVLGGNAAAQQQGSHLNALVGSAVGDRSGAGLVDENSVVAPGGVPSSAAATPMMQYSAAVSNTQLPTPQQQTQVGGGGGGGSSSLASTQYNNTADTFANAASAAANMVQQVQQQQQQQTQIKSSATLSAEQSQYFNSLTSQNTAGVAVQQQQQQQQQQPQMPTYAQSTAVQYPTSYANVFGSAAGTANAAISSDQTQLNSGQQPQVRRARAKVPPPSKIPASAVEMPGDTLNNIGYLDVQFGGLDFGTDDTFDALPEKFNAAVTIDSQQQQQQQLSQEVGNEKSNVQQQQSALTAGLQASQISDALTSGGYSQRGAVQQQQQQVVNATGGSAAGVTASSALDQLTKNDPYNQTNASSTTGYHQSTYQSSAAANKAANPYQQSAAGQSYNISSYTNAQSSIASTYPQQVYGPYQPNSVNSYQQQQQQQTGSSAQNAANSVVAGGNSSGGGSATQNIPVGGSASSNNATGNTNAGYLSAGYPSQQSAYQSSQSVYGSTGLSNNTGFAGSTNTSSSQYSNFSTSAKLKDTSTASSGSHYDGVSVSSAVSSSGTAVNSVTSSANAGTAANTNNANVNVNSNANAVANSNSSNSSNANNSNSGSSGGGSGASGSAGASGVGAGVGVGVGVGGGSSSNASSVVSAAAGAGSSSSNKANAGGMVPNVQMVSQFIQTGLQYYQQPVYSYEDLQMIQPRVPHVQGYYDLNYPPTTLGTGRDNIGYSTMTDGRFARTDNNSSPVSNVSSTMSQQAGSSGPMLTPYYFYSGNVMPGSFQYGTPTAIYPQQIPAANTASGGQFPKPSYSTGYGSTSYDTLSQASQDYSKGGYPSSVNQQTKSQNVANPPQAGTGSDITSSMYGKGHVALNKVNSYEKQNFHSGTPPPFNMPNTQTAGGTSAQPYGMYVPMAAAGHHNIMHPAIHQMDGRIHNSSRRDSNSTGQRQQTSNQSKSATKQGYSPSYWTGQN